MAARFRVPILVCLCLPAVGCGLVPLPYVTDVSGPVRGIRVLDMRTGQDIAGASATVESGMGMTDSDGPAPPQLFAAVPEAGQEPPASQGLTRGKDQAFHVPRCIVLGIVGRGYAQANPPTATINIFAPGYVRATLEYCVEQPPQAGWSESRSLLREWAMPGSEAAAEATDSPGPSGDDELVRCEFHEDGILRFFLRHMDSATPLPALRPLPAPPCETSN